MFITSKEETNKQIEDAKVFYDKVKMFVDNRIEEHLN
jgi:hypothetical protein